MQVFRFFNREVADSLNVHGFPFAAEYVKCLPKLEIPYNFRADVKNCASCHPLVGDVDLFYLSHMLYWGNGRSAYACVVCLDL